MTAETNFNALVAIPVQLRACQLWLKLAWHAVVALASLWLTSCCLRIGTLVILISNIPRNPTALVTVLKIVPVELETLSVRRNSP